MYDFHKERDTGDYQIYSHPFFRKGDKENLAQVHRKTSDQYLEEKSASGLQNKYEKAKLKMSHLTDQKLALEKNYQETNACNQDLLCQIYQSYERVQKIEQFLLMFFKQVDEIPSFLDQCNRNNEESQLVKPVAIPGNCSSFF